MADNHDYIALDWVKGEIEQTLTQARSALELFVEQQQDSTQLTFCLNYIHQVHGTLQMVEFYGAALLAEEMEKLCQFILEDKSTNLEEALEVLMTSILQLQNYLEHIQSGQKDLPVILLPTLNDLRASQGQPLLSDTSLFTPDLAAADVQLSSENNKRMQDPQVIANLRKLRQMFQASLVGILRDQHSEENFSYLYKVLARLEKFCHNTPIGKIWWVAVGFLDLIQARPDDLGSATKQLLRELDHLLKVMIDEHDSILSRPLPADLLKNMLYYIAQSDVQSERLDQLKQAFNLAQALPNAEEIDQERQRLQGPNKETMNSVVEALNEELSQVKDALDLYVRSDDRNKDSLAALVAPMNQIANTLAVLGLGLGRAQLLSQVAVIDASLASDEAISDQLLMDMAAALLQVEASLSVASPDSDMASSAESEDEFVVPVEKFEDAHNAVIFESKNGLELAKNSIVSFIASEWDHAEIADVPELLDSIRGGMDIIPLPRAATLLGACSQYIRETILAAKSVPDWEALDRLADAITSIEYYLERLTVGAVDNEQILSVAEESLAKLGFSPTTAVSGHPAKISEHHQSVVASESPEASLKESDDALLDDEILEIFVEEAAEVQDEIRQALQQLEQASSIEALKELRRAFHTLKGSGRLVGATAIGDLSWQIEDLLNKHVEQEHELAVTDLSLLNAVLERLPALVQDFSQQTQQCDVDELQTLAAARLEAFKAGSLQPQAQDNVQPEQSSESNQEPDVRSAEQTPPEESVADEPVEEDDLIDDEIIEIFIEEAGEVSATINQHLPNFIAEFDNTEALSELRRAYHTLKGSGRMVGATLIGDIAWSIENMLNRVIDGSILINQDIADLVSHVSGIIPELVECFRQRTTTRYDLERLCEQADALSKGELVQSLSDLPTVQDQASTSSNVIDAKVGIDDTLLEIFESEALVHITQVEAIVERVQETGEPQAIDDSLSRALHTLKGSANTASVACIAEVAIPIEKCVKEARSRQLSVTTELAQLLQQAMTLIKDGLTQLESPPESLAATGDFLAALEQYQTLAFQESEIDSSMPSPDSHDPQLVAIFLTEGSDILEEADKVLADSQDQGIAEESLQKLAAEMKTLYRGARLAGLDTIASLCEALESSYQSYTEQTSELQLPLARYQQANETLLNMMDQAAAGLTVTADEILLNELEESASTSSQIELAPLPSSMLEDKIDELDKELDEVLDHYSAEPEEATETSIEIPASPEGLPDAEIVEIFLDEAQDIIAGLPSLLEQFRSGEQLEQVVPQLERDFHTLKGGARMAQIEALGDLAHALERLCEFLNSRHDLCGEPSAALLDEAYALLQMQLSELSNQQVLSAAGVLIDKLDALRELSVTAATELEASSDEEAPVEDQSSEGQPSEELILDVPAESDAPSQGSGFALDPELVEIFLEEARDIVDNSGELLHQWETDTHNLELVAELQRELHTLKGGARMAEIAPIGDIAHELETLFERIVENRFDIQTGMISLCLGCHDALANMVDAVAHGNPVLPATELLAQVQQVLATGKTGTDVATGDEILAENTAHETEAELTDRVLGSDLLALFLDEGTQLISSARSVLTDWLAGDDDVSAVKRLQRDMHTLKGGARLAELEAIADVADATVRQLERLTHDPSMDAVAVRDVVAEVLEGLTEQLAQLRVGEELDASAVPELRARILSAGETTPLEESATVAEGPILQDAEALDLEVLEIFVEEAKELIEALEVQISEWDQDSANDDHNREIQRILHTLKGGARLSNYAQLADESHALETQLIAALNDGTGFDGELKKQVLQKQDVLLKLVDAIQEVLLPDSVEPNIEPTPETVTEPAAVADADIIAEDASSTNEIVPVKKSAPASSKKAKKNKTKAAPQETIRVSSGLMEGLVNLAGETSISRGRLETQISDFGFTLEEMSATIERLREQLRRMEMETEAQVLFRAEREGLTNVDYDDFDPLEMDRYSSIQQLSRSLTESTTDLLELRESLADKARGAETLLLQQARINSELQENLMQTRMIPFSSMVPRLRRIVRQISGELDKDVNFDVSNAEGEMDRSVLERMLAPLEHMLRNALDHGIETKAQRSAAGKPKEGSIRLSLSREGGDVVLRMKDDGAGISDQRILEKAISQGLVSKDAQASRHDILQFIMLPGFSTAEKVTQISGRGVGMDVVASEIKQMGGSIEIDSTLGHGTEFTVRLPFTVSVNRALMVSTGEDFYAIPLNTIEGIVRVSPFELEEYYKDDAPMYEYAGREYKLQYLGKLLHTGHQPKLQGQPLPLPVILVRGTDRPMALQVDSLMGSREIVVKSLGPQFGGVHAVSGATILGDGSVVVILDLPALIRDDTAGLLDRVEDESVITTKDKDSTMVMVVDDSVTVRKVTTRLLERNGMEVVTAKDGVDAIAQLQDCKPDVMLLDIEMPRMDGFEVATLVRHDERLKDVPIIMITSRTGQKHRERALSIGVNEYLGKPFQEQDLLDLIERLS